jgi:hypothetical protein
MKGGSEPLNPVLQPGEEHLPRVIVPSYVTVDHILEQKQSSRSIEVTAHEVDLFRQVLQEFREKETARIISLVESLTQCNSKFS